MIQAQALQQIVRQKVQEDNLKCAVPNGQRL